MPLSGEFPHALFVILLTAIHLFPGFSFDNWLKTRVYLGNLLPIRRLRSRYWITLRSGGQFIVMQKGSEVKGALRPCRYVAQEIFSPAFQCRQFIW